jgi:hypothetical protein
MPKAFQSLARLGCNKETQSDSEIKMALLAYRLQWRTAHSPPTLTHPRGRASAPAITITCAPLARTWTTSSPTSLLHACWHPPVVDPSCALASCLQTTNSACCARYSHTAFAVLLRWRFGSFLKQLGEVVHFQSDDLAVCRHWFACCGAAQMSGTRSHGCV